MDDEEGLKNSSERRRIEGAVLQILKASDLETATESSVRAAAAERLGFELSGLEQRRLVQQIIDSFLLSNAASILGTTSSAKDCDGGSKIGLNGERRRKQQHLLKNGGVVVQGSYTGNVVCKLTDRRWVTIHEHQGDTLVSIGDFVAKDGNIVPRRAPNAGITLSTAQWSSFRKSFSSIEEAIVKLESWLGSEAAAKPSEADLKNSVADSVADQSQAGARISNLVDVVHSPIRRKHIESEAEITSAVEDSAAEHIHIKAGNTGSKRIFRPCIRRQQTESNASLSANGLNSQEHILAVRKLEEAGASGSVTALESQENAPAKRNQSEAQPSLPLHTFDTQGQVHGTSNVVHPEQPASAGNKETEADVLIAGPTFPLKEKLHPERLIPIQTDRFDGKNYHSWRRQMELFLNQLNIAYVLTEPCPRVSMNLEVSFNERVKVQRWIDVDYLCRHNILNSLCDNLFQLYSQKVQSARELWEELNLAYNDDFRTKRSQINKYIHFQMVDVLSILDQVQELHRIANSIMDCGTWIDENVHVSVIISKLPPSWKDFRDNLMHEGFVPFNVLMHRLQAEEDYRNWNHREYKNGHVTDLRLDCRPGCRNRENKRVCYSCGKEGHIIKNCPNRKFDTGERSNEKNHNGVFPPHTGDIFVEAAANTE